MKQDPKKIFLSLIQSAQMLLEEETSLLASEDDANYFRSLNIKTPPPILNLPNIPNEKEILRTTKENAFSPPIPSIEKPAEKIFNPIKIELSSQKNKPVPALPSPNIKSVVAPSFSPVQETSAPNFPNFATIKSLLTRTFPQIPIISEIPNDGQAKKIANRWKTKNQVAPISILYFGEPEPQRELLNSLYKAIDIYFGPAKLIQAEAIEKEKQWDAFLSSAELKWVISCDYTLWQLSDLMRHYKENPTQKKRMLGNVSLFLLPDLSLYLKDPLLKRSLWKALCQTLSS